MSKALACPLCQTPMPERAFGSTRVHSCESGCGGLWFEADELRKLDSSDKGFGPHLQRAIQVSPIPAREGRVLCCPTCASELSPGQHQLAPEVEIDLCHQCYGIFLDAGEFAALRARSLTKKEILAARSKRQRRRRRQARMRATREKASDDMVDMFFLGMLMGD